MADKHQRQALAGPATERLALIDTLRALALFGVVVMNLMGMVMLFKADQVLAAATPFDMGVGAIDLFFLMGKARSAFAFLFGVGFGMMLMRGRSGPEFARFHLWRMTLLLAIGVLHMAFLFWGDILILYALLGMALLLFRNASDALLLRLGLTLVILPPLVVGAVEAVMGAPVPNLAGLTAEQVFAQIESTAPVYAGGDYVAFVRANVAYYLSHVQIDTGYVAVYDLSVFGLFLIGFWTARRGVLRDVEAHRPLLRRIAWVALPGGLLLGGVYMSRMMGVPTEGAVGGLVTAAYVGLPLAALGYIAALSLWITRGGRWLTTLFAPMGRMALTGYLSASAIGSFVWYGWGLGLMTGSPLRTPIGMNLFGIAVFAGLCVFSALWLKHFRFGPAEWLWRSLAYRKLQPLRR
ncbi:DUF418 domain-containing protein [Brevundimonas lutea]|uniref:DUF418 domain-containing protein n=1 Tax=Brevundimonas lutea TaxID=2293980 RepID=UPI000F0417BD|nr:DUF418 domain-containing protein [Brevundimonas lutea]